MKDRLEAVAPKRRLPKDLARPYKIEEGEVFPNPRYPWRNWKLMWEIVTGKKPK